MRLKHLDLILILTIAIMNVIWALLPSHPPVIGIVLALPLVFFLPGYILTEVLFHIRFLSGVYRFILSVGLSLGIDVLSGFVLNMLPAGLRALSWTMFLGLLVAVFSLLVVYLRRGASINKVRLLNFRLGKHEYVLVGLSIILAVLSIQYSAISVAQQPHPDFTQLWMLPSTQVDNNCAVRLGIQSFESTSVTYKITMTVDSVQVNTWSSIVLAPQEEWYRLVPITPRPANNIYIEVRLYKLDKPETVYREVHMTFNSSGGSNDRKMYC